MLPIVILAGGMATRLYPITRTTPKSLVTVAGRPFIDHQLSLLSEKGIKQVVLCLGYLGGMIETYVGDGSRYGLVVSYSYDGATPLGTGGAIKRAANVLPDDFLIMYGDSYLDIDIEQVVQQYFIKKKPVLMTVYRNRDELEKSNIIVRDQQVVRYDKTVNDPAMEYIDYGLIAIRKDMFSGFPPDQPFDLSMVLSRMAELGRVAAWEVSSRFYEVGSFQGKQETEEYIQKRISGK